ncbi:MAG: hypothetical protein AAFX45_02300 [Pseudomonadota bacterium]
MLVGRSASVAALCRDLRINRTQFNRYLDGTSFPRPDVLARITHHFNLDARILTTPIDQLDAEAGLSALLANVAPSFARLASGFDHNRMPDGLYRVTLPKLTDPRFVSNQLIQLRTVIPGTVVADWSLPAYYARLTGAELDWSSRRASGIVLQHIDGVSFYFSHPASRIIRKMYFSYGFQGASHIHTGVVTSTTQGTAGALPAFPAVLHQVPRQFADHMAARRSCGFRPREQACETFIEHARNTGFLPRQWSERAAG